MVSWGSTSDRDATCARTALLADRGGPFALRLILHVCVFASIHNTQYAGRMQSNTATDAVIASRVGQPLTVLQAADALNVSPLTVRAWIAQRRIGFVRLGRAVRVPANEIQRLLDRGFVPAESGETR